jgi:SAM-dependent methyltransferase
MDRPGWAPEEVDLDRPSAARSYDYLLGGSHNFAIDREVAHQAVALMPDLARQARANRAFLYRAVRYLVDTGIHQFIDIGSGVPTVGNVHEVAQRVDPRARVVYVDIDSVAVAHCQAILAGNPQATILQEDLRSPARILEHPELRRIVDLDQPVGLLVIAILHAIPDRDDPHRIVGQLRDALAPGSHLVLSHATADSLPEIWERVVRLSVTSAYPVTPRSRAEVERFLAGFELVAPGLVWAPLWRPEHPDDVGEHPERSSNYAGVGRRP